MGRYTVPAEQLLEYHKRHKPQALLLSQKGALVVEHYDGGFNQTKAHALYSGTKGFWGPVALRAQREGILELDEPAQGKITFRQLLNLTAGYGFGGLGSSVPLPEHAIEIAPKNPPGTAFTYGGIPLQVFGYYFSQRLAALALTPHEYLQQKILEPAGVEVTSWRTLSDGTHPLPTGAFLTARSWLRYGQWILGDYASLTECFQGSSANPRYGLGWWLTPPKINTEVFYASGSGGQALYVVPSLQTVAVRFGNGGSFNHAAFLKKLLAG